MKKEEFNALTIEDQVKTMNEAIKEGGSIRKALVLVDMSKTTIRDRFKKFGYLFQESTSEYVHVGENTITKLEQEQKTEAPAEAKVKKPQMGEQWKKDLDELLKVKNEILELVNTYKSQQKECPNLISNLKTYSSELKVKSVKIYTEVLEQLEIFQNANRNINQQEIFNQALSEFLERYSTEDKK